MLTDYEIVEELMDEARDSVDELKYNENLSSIPEIKIMFDAYGDDDDLGEGMNKNIENYYMFIHTDALSEGFVFSEHETFRGTIIQHLEEIRIPVIYTVDERFWDINFLDEYDEDVVSNILQTLYTKYND